MKLSIMQGYLSMFFFLEKEYEENKIDDLGDLLGSLNPFLFEGGMPADIAAWNDWNNSVRKVTVKDTLDHNEVIKATLIFLEFYKVKFGFDLDNVLEQFNNSSIQDRWMTFIKMSMKINNKGQ